MAVYDLEEQESIDALKAWWRQYGRLVIAAVVAFVLGVGGIQGWRYWQTQQGLKAAALYGELEEAVRLNDAKRTDELARQVIADFGRTTYGAKAALLSARVALDAGDAKLAEERLRWAADRARDEQTRALANLRLSALLLDGKQYDDALKVLSVAHPEPFSALFADARGDVLVAQGKMGEARTAYQAALDKLPKSAGYRNLVEIKRDALGDGQ
ncbi:MAG: tetratricopeptide repeat protein [Burkholderiales bacterium]|nr:tetratricopeptide repeat protein [Burkholderiales bacterium]